MRAAVALRAEKIRRPASRCAARVRAADDEDRRDGTANLKGSRAAQGAAASYGARFAGKKNGRSGKYDRAAAKHERRR